MQSTMQSCHRKSNTKMSFTGQVCKQLQGRLRPYYEQQHVIHSSNQLHTLGNKFCGTSSLHICLGFLVHFPKTTCYTKFPQGVSCTLRWTGFLFRVCSCFMPCLLVLSNHDNDEAVTKSVLVNLILRPTSINFERVQILDSRHVYVHACSCYASSIVHIVAYVMCICRIK